MTEMLDGSLAPWWGGEPGVSGMMNPAFDIKERKDAFEITADLPGVREQDVDVTLTGNRLTVTGKRETQSESEGERYHSVERSYGSFSRSFNLPDGTDLENVDADLDGGVLTVSIPKSEAAKPKKISLKQRVKKAIGTS